MGPERSLPRLAEQYQGLAFSGEPVPTQSLETLQSWSSKYGWRARVQEADGQIKSAVEDFAQSIEDSEDINSVTLTAAGKSVKIGGE